MVLRLVGTFTVAAASTVPTAAPLPAEAAMRAWRRPGVACWAADAWLRCGARWRQAAAGRAGRAVVTPCACAAAGALIANQVARWCARCLSCRLEQPPCCRARRSSCAGTTTHCRPVQRHRRPLEIEIRQRHKPSCRDRAGMAPQRAAALDPISRPRSKLTGLPISPSIPGNMHICSTSSSMAMQHAVIEHSVRQVSRRQ